MTNERHDHRGHAVDDGVAPRAVPEGVRHG